MNTLLTIIGWIVFIGLTSWAILFGVGRGTRFKDKEEQVSIVYILAGLVIAVITKILFIDNIWAAFGIWLVVGFIFGYLAGRYLSSGTPDPGTFFTFDELASAQGDIAKMGEMYFQCPKCGTYERVNNVGKMMLRSDPKAFKKVECVNDECNHKYNARARLKKGRVPGFDYSAD